LPRSKQAGHLEPFSEATVMIAKGAAFDKLAVASFVHSVQWAADSTQLASYVLFGAFADLVIRLLRPGISDERIFFLLRETVEAVVHMPTAPSPDRARFLYGAASLRLIDLLGYAPDIDVHEMAPLLKFMRRAPFADLLRVTATRETLNAAAAFVDDALTHAPLHAEPHGPRTIQAYLA
jgi:hypothetical protein